MILDFVEIIGEYMKQSKINKMNIWRILGHTPVWDYSSFVGGLIYFYLTIDIHIPKLLQITWLQVAPCAQGMIILKSSLSCKPDHLLHKQD